MTQDCDFCKTEGRGLRKKQQSSVNYLIFSLYFCNGNEYKYFTYSLLLTIKYTKMFRVFEKLSKQPPQKVIKS